MNGKKCKKVKYWTELSAKIAVGLAGGQRRGAKGESAYYRCPQCNGAWHTTSIPRKGKSR